MDTYKCDGCKDTFLESEVKLVEPIKNFSTWTPVLTINSVTKKIIRQATDQMEPNDMLLACPKCDKTHLFGFDKVA